MLGFHSLVLISVYILFYYDIIVHIVFYCVHCIHEQLRAEKTFWIFKLLWNTPQVDLAEPKCPSGGALRRWAPGDPLLHWCRKCLASLLLECWSGVPTLLLLSMAALGHLRDCVITEFSVAPLVLASSLGIFLEDPGNVFNFALEDTF